MHDLSALSVAAPLPQDVKVSFEFFPPSTEKMEQSLWTAMKRLEPLGPSFVSVTYGAGGSTRERTHATVARILKETSLKPHGSFNLCRRDARRGRRGRPAVLERRCPPFGCPARRPPEGEKTYTPHPGGYAYANDLVEGLKKVADFEISVAAYPEVHPEATSAAADMDYLKKKIDAGATRAITQYFFEVEHYLRFLDKARGAGIDVPIVAGILPVSNFAQVARFSKMCGATVPKWLAELFEGLEDDPETRQLVAATVAAEQCRVLNANGVNDFHFYTLNRADLTYAICHILGVRPKTV